MNFLLTTLNAKYIHSNLAIRLLYQLNKQDERLSWKEFTIKENADAIAEYCSKFDVVAFSCYIWNIEATKIVCSKIKALNTDCKILLGGPEVSYENEEVIQLPYIDYIITGEGEEPFSEFLKNFPEVKNIPSLVHKENGEVTRNRPCSNFDVKNLETIYPYCDDNTDELRAKVLYMETSRGCPYKCEFCLASLDNKVRYLPMENIKQNLLFMMQHGRVIKFLDRTFNIKKDFTLEIFQFILDHHQPGNVFQFEITADILHPEIIRFVNEKVPQGLMRFEIGIQTVNQKANLEVSRKQNFEKTKSIIEQVRNKVELHLDLIVGLPLDYLEDIRYSFEEVFKLFAPELQLGFLKFLRGTPVRDKQKLHGFQFDPVAPYQIIESNYLSKEELHQITELEHALEIYWNSHRATETLKYISRTYSSFDFLSGLGRYFSTQKDFHHYTQTDTYRILFDYARKHYPNDTILHDLIAIEYHLAFKTKPANLFIEEPDNTEKQNLLRQLQLKQNKLAHIVLPVSIDYQKICSEATYESCTGTLIIEYNSTDYAIIKQYIPVV